MGVREESSKRRKSIAGTSSRSSLGNKGRRRAYSIAPGSALSPLAKARRDLVPRKSILKVPVAILHGDDPSFTPSPDTSETRDFTNDFNRRKSLGRRVSFSSTAHIRYFKKQPRPSDAASSETGSMDGSPDRAPPPPPPRPTNDENAYPGSTSNRRRSSVGRPSMAPSDMDVTGVFDFAQQSQGGGGSALDDSEDSYVEDGDDGDMDVTQSMPSNLARRKSSVAFQEPADASDASNMSVDPDQTGSYMEESTMQSDTEPLECEVPLGQALNPPVSNDAWDALEQAANENVSPGNDEDDDLEDAIQRLRRASAFLPQSGEISEDSFASTEDSFNPDGEETMNISRALGRVSMGGNTNLARMSMGGESAMDESEVYGHVGVEPELPPTQSPPNSQPQQPAPVPAQQQQHQHQQPTQTLAASTTQTSHASTTQPLAISSNKAPVFRPPPLNSITGTPKPGFSAAFAPPTAKPSPRKFGQQQQQQQQQESATVPEKRARNENEAGKRPPGDKGPSQAASGMHLSPPQAGTSKTSPQGLAKSTAGPAGPSTSPQPRPLSPSRGSTTGTQDVPPSTGSPPRKKASIGMGRASMGVAGPERMPSTHRRTSLQPPVPVLENGKGMGRAVLQEPEREDERNGEDMEVDEDVRGREEEGDGKGRPSGGETGVDTQRMQAWVDGVDQENPEQPEEVPQVSIQEFFEITGIKFIDEMIAPRRSIAPRQARPADIIPLSEYLVALAVDLPQLDLYGRVAEDLARSNAKYKENFEEMEREAALDTPELFQEYMLAEPEDQEGFRHYLTLIKANARMQAKSAWYSWKSTWVEELTGIAQSELEAMEADTKTIAELNAQLETALPELERQHAEVTAQLEKERAEIAEVEACNQDWLNELKSTIADQSTEIRSFETELAQVRSGKQHVQARIDEYEAEKQEHMAAIANANRMLDVRERRTHSEVRRLQAELDALEDLHQFRMRTIRPDFFEYEFLDKYLVSLPCRAFQPVNQGISITYLPGRPIVRDDFPKYTALVLQTAKRRIIEGPNRTIPKIVQELRDYFFSCKELRSQLGLITVKYPVELSVLHDQGEALMATAIVLFKPVKAKAFVSFIFADEVFATWPHSIKGVRVKVDVAYGQIDPELLSMAVTSRLAEATLQDNYACLLDACIQAQEQYPAAESTAMET
ncbi:Spc7 kinetochore protein-domain-containing protein [Schizophyllum commune]